MVYKYTNEKIDAEIIQDAVDIRYEGEYVHAFFRKAERLYKRAGFGNKAKFGLVVKAIKTHKKMLEFVLVHGSNTFDEVKNSCTVYENN